MLNWKISQEEAATELLLRRRARTSLVDFAQAVEVPGRPIGDDPEAWMFYPIESPIAAHHVLILAAWERTMAKRYGRLMIFAPPGAAKSIYSSVAAPSYLMGKKPGTRIILASYGSDLARKHGRRARQLCRSESYEAIFSTTVSKNTAAADEWALTNGSEYLAGGLLSGLTGNRADGLVIDDPIKGRQEADSVLTRTAIQQAYEDDAQSRLTPGAWIGLITTRWHEADLAASILPKGYAGESGLIMCRDGRLWEVLNFQAQAERADDPLGRKPGEYMWPEYWDAEHWISAQLNPRSWNALYQQRPKPIDGGIFKPEWFRRHDLVPIEANICVHSWDTAYKPGQLNDPSVGGAWQLGRAAPHYYLTDVFRQRLEYPDLKRQVVNWAMRDNPRAILIEDKASGQSLIQDLRATKVKDPITGNLVTFKWTIIPIEPEGDKLTRASAESIAVEGGKVSLPNHAQWLADFEGEVFSFPEGVTHDDQVDMLSQFLAWVRHWNMRFDAVGSGKRATAVAMGDTTMKRNDRKGFGTVGGRVDTRGF